MDPIGTFSGLASGIQWRDMVDQMMQLEISRRITPLQNRVNSATGTKTAWNTYSGLLTKLVSATDTLRDQSAFGVTKSSVAPNAAGKSVLTASTSSTASPGSYQVEVIDLARAEKLSGAAFAATTTAAGVAGEFYVNGRKVELASTDSLTAIRDKVNRLNSGSTPTGVTATILSTSDTQHRLVLTSDSTGSRGIELVEGATGALGSLGILSGALVQNTKPGDPTRTQSQRVSSHTGKLAATLGVSPNPAVTTIIVDGRKIQVDLENDTLLSLSSRIQAAGGTAEIVDESVGGRTMKRLSVGGEVTADATGSDPATSQRLVELLGFQTGVRTSQIATGRDALFRIDGFAMTRRTNTVSDAISGVTLNLTAPNGGLRTSTVSSGLSLLKETKALSAGSYGITLTTAFQNSRTVTTDSANLSVQAEPGIADGSYAVVLSETTTRSTSADPNLTVVAAPGTVSAGTFNIDITVEASVASKLGSGFGASYSKSGGPAETITITDAANATATVSLSSGQTIDTIVTNLNAAFATNGVTMLASAEGGQLKLTSTTAEGSTSAFTVSSNNSNVAVQLGIANGGYAGTDIDGTINGLAATGAGSVLTGTAGAAFGLKVAYSGTGTGLVGAITVEDSVAVTGGTIGGFAATWDAATGTLEAAGGSPLAGLKMAYSGTATSGSVGNVVVAATPGEYVTGASIDGEAAIWNQASRTITGAAGSRFEGLVMAYNGAATSGTVGSLTVDGDIAVEVNITRDLDATVEKLNDLAKAYNELVTFADAQRVAGAPLYANGSLRSMQSSVKAILLGGVQGLSASNPYTHTAIAGVSLQKDGKLSVDTAVLKSALETNQADIRSLFSKSATPTDSRVTFISGGDKVQPGNYAIDITAAAAQATHAGSSWGGGSYTATDNVDDTLTVTNSSTGVTTSYTVTHGKALAEVIAELNTQFAQDGAGITASDSNGGLKLTSGSYGSGTTLTVGGDAAAPLGLTAGTYAGADVAGTIGGLAATGSGQTLTGTTGAVEGVIITYSDSAVGSAGELNYILGVAGMFERLISPLTRPGDGTLVAQTRSLDSSIEVLNKRMDDAEARLEVRRQALILQFTRMESALSSLQSQGSWLTSQIKSMQQSSGE